MAMVQTMEGTTATSAKIAGKNDRGRAASSHASRRRCQGNSFHPGAEITAQRSDFEFNRCSSFHLGAEINPHRSESAFNLFKS
jgi:hypothetical protein